MNVQGANGVATLTGSTGTDTKVNISVDASTGEIHIENRAANNNDLSWHIVV